MKRFLAVYAACLLAAAPAAGFELVMPKGARQISERISALDSYVLPTAPFDGNTVPARRVEGRVERQTWRIEMPGLTTLQVLDPLRTQLNQDGYDILFDCDDRACGGFDFRFATEVVPAPDMYVDIRNYRFVSALRDGGSAISLLVSQSRSAAYVQIIYVNRGPEEPTAAATPAPVIGPAADSGDTVAALVATGHVVLGDLQFETGADALDAGTYASLERLAAYLKDNPGVAIALVGHTDNIGGLDANIALSKNRAESVRTRLIGSYGIAPERIQAEGMGYLAPVSSNLTADGREMNRRVEAILLSDG